MPSTKELRVRIQSVKSTQQTTKAMKMVAASKLKRAQSAIMNARPYALGLERVVTNLVKGQDLSHRLCQQSPEDKKVLYVVFSSDRGLCGGFNSGISKFSMNEYKQMDSSTETDILFVGKKAASYFRNRKYVEKFDIVGDLAKVGDYSYAKKFTDRLINFFENEGYDKVYLLYNEFVSALSQDPKKVQLLPVKFETEASEDLSDYIFKPNAGEIVDTLIDKHVYTQVHRAILESLSSEHAARMNAMENATKNAGEILKSLTLTYNKIRQAAITTELIEITSGAEAIAN
ncbi:MAG: ATP synthase F1 subunit gamma [Bdellovibrionales bacterium]